MAKYFGTDGVRAVAGQFPLVDDFIQKLGYAALRELQEYAQNDHLKPQVIIAQDSRASGPAILAALEKGIRASGADVISVGIAPTPAVAYLVKHTGSLCGVVISASHNPAEFNGIKFFTNHGTKLPEELENSIEAEIESLQTVPAPKGAFKQDESLVKEYERFLMSTVDASLLKGTKVVLDCANGASSKVAVNVFAGLGMDVTVTAAKPDGTNINKNVGALHTEFMQQLTQKEHAFVGFSFDGDADRVIASDEKGRQLDGDNIIASSALCMKQDGQLNANKAVLTIMANLGCINYLKENGVDVELTTVGDKYVSARMQEGGYSIGGEESGHIIFSKYSTTGDGILTAIRVMEILVEKKTLPSFLTAGVQLFPKVQINKRVKDASAVLEREAVKQAVRQAEEELGETGRVLIRKSGTEPVIRLIVEADEEEKCRRLAERIASEMEE